MERQSAFPASPVALTGAVALKVDYREDIRRFNLVLSSLDALRTEIFQKYSLDPKNEHLVLKYKDEEGDLVTLANEEDLAEAIRIIRKTNGIFKVHIVKGKLFKPAAAAAPISATATDPKPTPRAPTSTTTSDEPKESKKEEAKLRRMEQREARKAERQKDKKKLDKHAARFVKDVGLQEGTELAPGTPFVKTWRFRNEGSMPWPEGCTLLFVSRHEGDSMGAPESVPVPTADVGQEVDVSVNMVAPTEPGRYVGFWRLAAPDGRKFGHRVRVLIHVVGSSSSSSSSSEGEEAEKKTSWGALLAQLEAMGFTDKELNLKLLHKHDCDLAKVVTRLGKKKEKDEKKAAKAEAKQLKEAKKAAKKEHKATPRK